MLNEMNGAAGLGREWLFLGRSSGHLCTKTVLRNHRPPGRRGRDSGGYAPAEALQEEGHAPISSGTAMW
ncbi:MAG: hypothetical protein WCP70_14625 [Methanothrix sp.]